MYWLFPLPLGYRLWYILSVFVNKGPRYRLAPGPPISVDRPCCSLSLPCSSCVLSFDLVVPAGPWTLLEWSIYSCVLFSDIMFIQASKIASPSPRAAKWRSGAGFFGNLSQHHILCFMSRFIYTAQNLLIRVRFCICNLQYVFCLLCFYISRRP